MITGISEEQLGVASQWNYAYDDSYRLIEAVKQKAGLTEVEAWKYDRMGNITASVKDRKVSQREYNGLNQLLEQSGGGVAFASGSIGKAGTLEIDGQVIETNSDGDFRAWVEDAGDDSSLELVATDFSDRTTTSTVATNLLAADSKQFQYDVNGNTTAIFTTSADGLTTSAMHFTWDALDRLVAVDHSDGRRTEFYYDGNSSRSRIVEKTNGVVSRETRLIWAGLRTLLEERAADNSTIARYFGNGFIDKDGGAWYYTRDHLGSVRVVTDVSGNLGAAYDYSAYGERTQIAGSLNLLLSFTGHWEHEPTGLVLAPFRAYMPEVGRWVNRDPIREAGGMGLYVYVDGDPNGAVDELGLTSNTTSENGYFYGDLYGDPSAYFRAFADDYLNWGSWDVPVSMRCLQNISNSVSGAGDTFSFGLTRSHRNRGGVDVVNPNSGCYSAGEAGAALLSLLGGGAGLLRNIASMGGKSGGMLAILRRGASRLFSDSRQFSTISRQYWRYNGGARGRSLHHWLIPQRAGGINAGYNLLVVPHRLNSWMGRRGLGRVFEVFLRLGIIGSPIGAGYAGVAWGLDKWEWMKRSEGLE